MGNSVADATCAVRSTGASMTRVLTCTNPAPERPIRSKRLNMTKKKAVKVALVKGAPLSQPFSSRGRMRAERAGKRPIVMVNTNHTENTSLRAAHSTRL
jgi:hypothetical protein